MPMPRNSRNSARARFARHQNNPTGNSSTGTGLSLAGPTNNLMTEGVAYSNSIVATGGTEPYAYAVLSGSLPAGVTIDAGSGNISGTPEAGTAGSYSVTFQVTDQTSDTANVFVMFEVAASNVPPAPIIPDKPTVLREVYVDVNNAGGPWDGTIANPWQTIQDGLDNAIDGDRINIATGLYSERVLWSSANDITLSGALREDGSPAVRITQPSESPTWASVGNDVWESTDFADNIAEVYWIDSSGAGAIGIPFIGAHQANHADVTQLFDVDDGSGVYQSLFGRDINYSGGAGIVFWECFKSCAVQMDNNTVRCRFSDGTDPNSLDIRAWRDDDRLIYTYPQTFSGCHITGIHFHGGESGLAARGNAIGNEAEDLTVDNCWFNCSWEALKIWTCSKVLIENCVFDASYHVESQGAWGTGSVRDTGNREFFYEFRKYVTNVSDSLQRGCTVQVSDNVTIRNNLFTGGMSGLMLSNNDPGKAVSTVWVHDNRFISQSSLGVYVMQNTENVQVFDNYFDNQNSTVRMGRLDTDLPGELYVYNNYMTAPMGLGLFWRNFAGAEVPVLSANRLHAFYQNTIAGGYDLFDYDRTLFDPNGGLPWLNVYNNFLSHRLRPIHLLPLSASGADVGQWDNNWQSGSDNGITLEPYWGANNIYDGVIGSDTYWGVADPKSGVIDSGHVSQSLAGAIPETWPNPDAVSAGDPVGSNIITWSDNRNIIQANQDFSLWTNYRAEALVVDPAQPSPFGDTGGVYVLNNDQVENTGGSRGISLVGVPELQTNSGELLIYSVYLKKKETSGRSLAHLCCRNSTSGGQYYTRYDWNSNRHLISEPQGANPGMFIAAGSEYANFGWRRIWAIRPNSHDGNISHFDDVSIFLDDPGRTNLWYHGSTSWTGLGLSQDFWIFGCQVELAGNRTEPTPFEGP